MNSLTYSELAFCRVDAENGCMTKNNSVYFLTTISHGPCLHGPFVRQPDLPDGYMGPEDTENGDSLNLLADAILINRSCQF